MRRNNIERGFGYSRCFFEHKGMWMDSNNFYFGLQFVITPIMTLFSQRRIETVHELPVQYRDRRITDVCCCCLGVIFGLIMFILACVLFNSSRLTEANFPIDSEKHSCATGVTKDGESRPFIFFNDLSNPLQNRYCVQDCPQPGVPTICWDGPCDMIYYPTYPSSNDWGSFCFPEDEDARNKLYEQTGLRSYNNHIKSIQLLLVGLGISVGLALLWMILVQFLPKIMVPVAFILAIVLLIITGIVFLIESDGSLRNSQGWAIFLAILAFVMALVLLVYFLIHRKSLKYCGVFLKAAGVMLKQNWKTFLYIPLFIIFTFLFGILIVFQYLAFASSTTPSYQEKEMYPKLYKNFWYMAPLVIETIWGLSFFRDAFNLCVSGCAIQWYFGKKTCCQPLKAFFCKHFGSVAGGSFYSAFFFFPSLFIDLCCNNKDAFCCNCLDLPRGDAYPYIYMTSTTYCPSVRQAQYLCKRSRICKGNRSDNTYYTLAGRLFLALASMLIIFWISQGSLYGGQQNPYLLLGVFFIGLYISVYFVDIHVDVGQALMIAFLAEAEVDVRSYRDLGICRDILKDAIADIDEETDRKR